MTRRAYHLQKTGATYPQTFFSGTIGRRKPRENQLTQFFWQMVA